MAPTPEAATTTASRLYYPFRALGAVTDGSPFVLSRRGDACFLAVSTDRAFQVTAAPATAVATEQLQAHIHVVGFRLGAYGLV